MPVRRSADGRNHSDDRSLCARERDGPFRIVNLLEIVSRSMGLSRHDRFRELKITQEADLIVAECGDMIVENSLDRGLAKMPRIPIFLFDGVLQCLSSTRRSGTER